MTQAKDILLVEDHVDSAQCLARSLTKLGHRVQIAASIAEAISLAAGNRFDLALCDLGLPDGDGCDLMRKLSAAHGLKGIALTGFGMPDDVARAAEAGFAAHVLKPVSIQKLVSVLDEVTPPPPVSGFHPSHANGIGS